MHPWRIVALAGAATGALGLLLPMVTLPVLGPIDGVDGETWPVFVALGPVILAAIGGDRREGLRPWIGVPMLVLSGAAVAFSSIKLADAILAARQANGSVGAGAWVIVVGTVAVMAGAGMSLRRTVG